MFIKISVLLAAVSCSAQLLGQNGHGLPPVKTSVRATTMLGQDGHGLAPKTVKTLLGQGGKGQLNEFHAIVEKVNSANAGWTAEIPTRFNSVADAKILCGTRLKGHSDYVNVTIPNADEEYLAMVGAIPDTYDARTDNTKNCTEIISVVRDQSACGSCWAFSATEAFEAAKCLAAGSSNVEYSPYDTAACCAGAACGFSQGCGGGQPGAALDWMTKTGVVTGGDYPDAGTPDGLCMPYAFAPCAHHVPPSSKYPACPSAEYSTKCVKTCESSYKGTYASDKAKGKKVFGLNSVQAMQQAIMATGPLSVAFTVYEDFLTYKTGVYTHKTGQELGGHAVLMLGWGTENGSPYWLVKNSWNEQWGDGGLFKIARGTDECGIEDEVVGISF